MKNWFIAIAVIGFGGLISWWLTGKSDTDLSAEDSTRNFNTLTKLLPALNPVMGGEPSNFTKKTLVILFNSECEHCQKETENLAKHMRELSDAQIWWVSFEEVETMSYFLVQKGVTAHPETYAFTIEPEKAMEVYGFLGMPQTFVYQDNRLMDAFLGPITFEEKLKKYFD